MGRVWAGECSGLSGRTGWDLRKDTGGPMLAGTLILLPAGESQRDHGWQMRLALEQQLCRCGGIRTSGSPRLRGCSAASGSSGLLPHPPLYPWDGTWRGGPGPGGEKQPGSGACLRSWLGKYISARETQGVPLLICSSLGSATGESFASPSRGPGGLWGWAQGHFEVRACVPISEGGLAPSERGAF